MEQILRIAQHHGVGCFFIKYDVH